MRDFMYADFYVHLEGQCVEGKVEDVPVQQPPERLFRCHRGRARVAPGCHTVVAVVFSLYEDSVVRFAYGSLDQTSRD